MWPQGVRLMNLRDNQMVTSVTITEKNDDNDSEVEESSGDEVVNE